MRDWSNGLKSQLSVYPEIEWDKTTWVFKSSTRLSAVMHLLVGSEIPEARFLNLLAVVDQGGHLDLHHYLGKRVSGWDLCLTLQLEKLAVPSGESYQVDSRLSAPSFVSFYPYQRLQWKYLGELFGIHFGEIFEDTSCFLPSGWEGFPLRKDAVTATDFDGFVSIRFQHRQIP